MVIIILESKKEVIRMTDRQKRLLGEFLVKVDEILEQEDSEEGKYQALKSVVVEVLAEGRL